MLPFLFFKVVHLFFQKYYSNNELEKFSNLELLEEFSMNLYSTGDYLNMNGLCERDLAVFFNTNYQVIILV